MSKTQHNKYPKVLYITDVSKHKAGVPKHRSECVCPRNKSVVALAGVPKHRSERACSCNRSVVALARVPKHRSERACSRNRSVVALAGVPCHLIPGLRHSYNYMYSETSYLIIGHEVYPHRTRRGGEVRYIFHFISFLS